ncbi:MAG: shikimate kinase [Saprospiraceae bacterium]|nr:shikimate kinase [Saprospiraceae bacterium]
MIIYLVGYMGVGKTTVGQKLAQKLRYPFLDTDDIICSLEGKNISTVFSDMGEPYFRALETRVLSGIMHLTRAVVATGGGMACSDENQRIISQSGKSIYLKASPNFLAERLQEFSDRPIIEKHKDDLTTFISNHLQARSGYYDKASYIVDAEQPIEDIVDIIINQLG